MDSNDEMSSSLLLRALMLAASCAGDDPEKCDALRRRLRSGALQPLASDWASLAGAPDATGAPEPFAPSPALRRAPRATMSVAARGIDARGIDARGGRRRPRDAALRRPAAAARGAAAKAPGDAPRRPARGGAEPEAAARALGAVADILRRAVEDARGTS